MLVSHRKQFIYLKTAKTAGTSVESYFEPWCMPEGAWEFSHGRDEHVDSAGIIGCRPRVDGCTWYNHMPAWEIRSLLKPGTWETYFKFCIVRNPFDMLLSWFYFRVDEGAIVIANDESPVDAFRRTVGAETPVLGRNKYAIDGTLCVDYAIRYEELLGGIAHVCRLLDIPFEPDRLPRLKAGLRDWSIPIRDFYTAKMIERVLKTYNFERVNFGYEFPADTADLV